MTDQDFERKEKARQDAMFDAQFADEPTSDVDYADEPIIAKSMTDRELMQMALDALITAELDGNCEYGATDALRTRLSQCDRCGEVNPAEIHTCSPQEPVAWTVQGLITDFSRDFSAYQTKTYTVPLYTAPPQRQQRTYTLRKWQGLTDEDWIIGKRSADYIAGAEWAEAKLKEKNG